MNPKQFFVHLYKTSGNSITTRGHLVIANGNLEEIVCEMPGGRSLSTGSCLPFNGRFWKIWMQKSSWVKLKHVFIATAMTLT